MRRTLALASLPWIIACKPPEDAPESISEPMVALFTGFDGDVEQVKAATVALEAALTGLDLSGDLNARVYTVPVLTTETLGTLRFPEGTDGTEQVPVAVAGQSAHPLTASLATVSLPSQVCIESNSTVWYDRTFLSDEACFTDRECDVLHTSNAVHKKKLIIDMWYELLKDYRTFSLDDGREAMIARSWTDQKWQGVSGSSELAMSFALEVWLPNADHPEVTDRFYAMWSGGDVGVDDGFYANIVKLGMDEGYQNADAFMSGGTDCAVEPDESDRPEDL